MFRGNGSISTIRRYATANFANRNDVIAPIYRHISLTRRARESRRRVSIAPPSPGDSPKRSYTTRSQRALGPEFDIAEARLPTATFGRRFERMSRHKSTDWIFAGHCQAANQ